MRSLWTATKSSPCLPQLEKRLRSNEDPAHSEKEINERNCMCIYVCVCVYIYIYKQIDMTIPKMNKHTLWNVLIHMLCLLNVLRE